MNTPSTTLKVTTANKRRWVYRCYILMNLCFLLALIFPWLKTLQQQWHYQHLSQHLCPHMSYPALPPSPDHKTPLLQTFYNKAAIPAHVHRSIEKMSQGYQRFLWDDDQARCFFMNFHPNYLSSFEKLRGAHRADLLRYLFLYDFGGVYLDIKTIPLKPLAQLFQKPWLYSARASSYVVNDWIYQGILASPAGNPFLLKLAENIKNNHTPPSNYGSIMVDFAQTTRQHTQTHSIHLGLNRHKKNSETTTQKSVNFYFFDERCARGDTVDHWRCQAPDRYGLCCYVFNTANEAIFLNRVHDYPWHHSSSALRTSKPSKTNHLSHKVS